MYRLLLVDDEYNIREGIANNCDWESLEIEECLTAENGYEALNIIEQSNPDIIITDIKMPGMSGLELIQKVSENYPDMEFAVLSGYNEFEFAQEALKYQVNDYVLKPCSVEMFEELVAKIVNRIKISREKLQYIDEIKASYELMYLQMKAQTIRDYVVNSFYSSAEWNRQMKFFKIPDIDLRILLFRIDENCDNSPILSLCNICKDVFGKGHELLLCTIVNGNVMVITDYYMFPRTAKDIYFVKAKHYNYYEKDITVAVSEMTSFAKSKDSYRNLLGCLKFRFYLGEGSIITTFDAQLQDVRCIDESLDIEHLALAVKSGNAGEVDSILREAFRVLLKPSNSVERIKAYAVEIYLTIVRQSDKEMIENYTNGVKRIMECTNVEALKSFISGTASSIAQEFYKNTIKRQNELIVKVVTLIEDNISDEELSLSHIANEILYVNVDYLGKLFIKEKGERFSHYLTKCRMEKAKSLFLQEDNILVSEVAAAAGFGYNAQYFSKVFKKYTGYTPKEFRNKFYQPE